MPDRQASAHTAITGDVTASSGPSTAPAAQDDDPGRSRKSTRRRGAALTQAIYQATFEEIDDVGFEGLAFDKIAPRAGTGKSALYRRWRTPTELVLDALSDPVAGFGKPIVPDTGSLRGDLIALLGAFAHVLDEPRGRALRFLIIQRTHNHELHQRVRELVMLPNRQILLSLLGAAVERGEADPACLTPRVASVGPRMILTESMDTGTVTEAEVQAIVDEVLLPLTAPRR